MDDVAWWQLWGPVLSSRVCGNKLGPTEFQDYLQRRLLVAGGGWKGDACYYLRRMDGWMDGWKTIALWQFWGLCVLSSRCK